MAEDELFEQSEGEEMEEDIIEEKTKKDDESENPWEDDLPTDEEELEETEI